MPGFCPFSGVDRAILLGQRRLWPAHDVEDDSAGGGKFQDALQLVTRLVNIGDCKTLACHPASTTHRQLGPEEMAKAGVSEDMIRLSIGIEHVDDLIADLDQALNAA